MTRVRRLEIKNFRSIQNLDWFPSDGVNCLIGPGDSGKSTLLDAIDLCIGSRRNPTIADTDFFNMDVSNPIEITITLGGLSDDLKNLDIYGEFLRGFDPSGLVIEDEPRQGLETVITLRLRVASDLEPDWTLLSDRAIEHGIERNLLWKDRANISPARLGTYSGNHLSWSKGSVLNKLSEERPDLGNQLANAAREARSNFGDQASIQLAQTISVVNTTASRLGVPHGSTVRALLDAHSVSINDGAIALHNESGIPLRSLGTGSSRLLIAGLQRAAAQIASVVLVDEVETGLEPHRLVSLLHSLGAKETPAPLQVFMTTHSPVVIRELNANQLKILRSAARIHTIKPVSLEEQGTARAYPEAFISRLVIVCEGASEVGFVRGFDQYYVSQGYRSLLANGVSYLDSGGGSPDKTINRAIALMGLGYSTIVLIDSDIAPTPQLLSDYRAMGGLIQMWRPGRALEDELFLSLDDTALNQLLSRAIEILETDMIDAHIRTQSNGTRTLSLVETEIATNGYSQELREFLGLTARKHHWYKSVSRFEDVAREIVAPVLNSADPEFARLINTLFGWAHA